MRRPPLMRTAVVAAATTLLVAGCGSGSATKSPQSAFRAGFAGIGHTSTLTVTLGLDTTPQALVGFAQKSGGTLNPTTAGAIAGASVVIEVQSTSGKDLSSIKPGSPTDLAVEVAIKDNGHTLAELIGRDDHLYVQADVKSALALFGKSKLYGELQARAATLPSFVKAFVAGKWVSLDLKALLGAVSQFGIAAPSAQQWAAFVKALDGVLATDLTVTRVGSDSSGDHLRLTAQSKKFVGDLIHALTTNVPALTAVLGKVAAKIPDHSIVVDGWVKDGSLSKLSLDIVQFAKPGEAKPGDQLPVVLGFDHSGGSIAAPSGATPVDLTQLLTLLGGLTGLGG